MRVFIRRRRPPTAVALRVVPATGVALVAIIAFAIIAVTAFALAGCGGGVEIGLGTGATEKTGGTETYTDPDYGYSFSYPGSWVVETGSHVEAAGGVSAANSVSVFDPKGAVAGDLRIDLVEFSVYELRGEVDDSMLPDVRTELEGVLAGWAAQDESWETIEPLAETTLAGLKGFVTTVGYDMDGVAATAELHFLFSGALEYEVMVQAATENWEAKQADFDAIVTSFAR